MSNEQLSKRLSEKEIKDEYENVQIDQCRTIKEFYQDLVQELIRFVLVGSVPLYFVVLVFAMFFGVVEPVLKYVTPFLGTVFALAFARYSFESKERKQGNNGEGRNE